MRGKLRARLGPSQSQLRAEALALTLLQPRRDLPPGAVTLEQYEAAPKLKTLTFDEINALDYEARLKMKRQQSEHRGAAWRDLARNLYGAMTLPPIKPC